MKRVLFIVLIANALVANAQINVSDYTGFMEQKHLSPKEYIIDLFKTNDIVIIGERDHRDTTQYDVIQDIIGDEWFIKNVGYVYTEVGVVNTTEWANSVLKGEYSNNGDFEKELIKLYREIDFNPIWDKYNMYKYLKGIYSINCKLENNEKVTVGFTDCEFDWEGMTSEKYKSFEKVLPKRDSLMANNFIKLFEGQRQLNGHRKALIIQSQPHAIRMGQSYKMKSFGMYVSEKYNQKVKVVLFNWYNWVPQYMHVYPWVTEKKVELVDDGKWDAAFEKTNCNPIGFNLKDSPFGETHFFYSYMHRDKFMDIADGIIYDTPFYRFVYEIGIPNVVDKKFSKELVNRDIVTVGSNSLKGIGMRLIRWRLKKVEQKYYNEVRAVVFPEKSDLKAQMDKWINK